MTRSSDKNLVLRTCRVIRANPERIYDAWISPSELRAWWGPAGVRCIHSQVDARPGGRYYIDNELPSGQIVRISGVFLEAQRPVRLRFTWRVGDDAREELVTVSFAQLGPQRTAVEVVHERIPNAAVRNDHEHGWKGCLEGLGRFIVDHG